MFFNKIFNDKTQVVPAEKSSDGQSRAVSWSAIFDDKSQLSL